MSRTNQRPRILGHVFLSAIVMAVGFSTLSAAREITAVSGSSNNGGQPNTLFLVDTDTGQVSQLGTTSVTPNSLGFDPVNNLFYFGNHNSNDFYVFDVGSGTDTLIGQGPVGTRFSGPGEFYNGRYYYVAEGPGGATLPNTNVISVFEISADGLSVTNTDSITVNLPAGVSGFGDFGDFAIDPSTGLLYASASNAPSLPSDALVGIFSVDLFATQTATLLNPNVGVNNPLQLAFNQDGELFGNAFTGASELLPVSTVDGSVGTAIPMPNYGGDFFDMATVPVPEPGTMVVLGGMLLFGAAVRRRA